jgi:hypothetical protein
MKVSLAKAGATLFFPAPNDRFCAGPAADSVPWMRHDPVRYQHVDAGQSCR